MNNFTLITEYSPWFLILCIAAGVGYSLLLYTRKHSWSSNINISLAFLRGVLVAFLAFLLLGPFVKHIKNYFEKPTMVIAIDNSMSLAYVHDSSTLRKYKNNLRSIAENIKGQNADIDIRLLNTSLQSDGLSTLSFSAPTTNISKLLTEIQSDYINRNLAGIILATDGIYNEGSSPGYLNFTTPVHTIGLGDTVPKKDLNLKSLLFNRITYTGNQFPIVAEIHHTGFKNEKVNLLLKQNNKILQKKSLAVTTDKGIINQEFQVTADKNGLQHFVLEIEPAKEEFTLSNNVQHAYIDVIEGKERILLLASAPHPDIKALKSAIEKKKNYELEVVIAGFSEYKPGKYDLVIYHQIPDNQSNFKDLITRFQKEGVPGLFIIGGQTSINNLNQINGILNLKTRPGQWDMVGGSINDKFQKFTFEENDKKVVQSYPPLSVPFGDYGITPATEIILYQQVGSLVTEKPLIAVSTRAPRNGIISGDGIWQWSLQEFKETGNTSSFDRLMTHMVQYLSSKEDKRKFRFFPVTNEFMVTDPVLFEAETYNDVYEKVYGQNINLTITDENKVMKTYNFVNGENSSRFEVKGLKEGIYKYTASTLLFGKTEKISGEFSIKNLNLEAISTTANHELLKNLSAKTGGKYFEGEKMEQITEVFKGQKFQSMIHSNEELDEMINLKWIFFVLLLFITVEWVVRKYKGSY